MVKFTKNKGWQLSEAEYNRLIKQDDGSYFIPVETCELPGETVHNIEIDILAGLSKPKICEKNHINGDKFDIFLEKQYRTKKITVVREYLKDLHEKSK
jgi:hypothetical protein